MSRYYLALGDSITSGYGVGSRNFASFYYSYLRTIRPDLKYVNCGIPGLTSAQLANLLSQNQQVRQLVTQAELITITIGSNDLLALGTAKIKGIPVDVENAFGSMTNNLELIGTQIRSLNPVATVKVASIYNPLSAGPFSQYAGQAQRIITQTNKVLLHWCKRFRFGLVPIDRVFQGKELLVFNTDTVHPNIAGHQAMAMAFSR